MTTITRKSGVPLTRLILVVFLLLLSMLAALTTSLPQHALDRHGQEAIRAHEAVAALNHGGKYDCRDGKRYEIADLGKGDWAVEISYAKTVVTAFVTRDRAYLARVLEEDECEEEWKNGHP